MPLFAPILRQPKGPELRGAEQQNPVAYFPTIGGVRSSELLGVNSARFKLYSPAKRKPPPLEVVYNISKKINSKAMPLKAFWL